MPLIFQNMVFALLQKVEKKLSIDSIIEPPKFILLTLSEEYFIAFHTSSVEAPLFLYFGSAPTH